MSVPLLLASASPRRMELLTRAGLRVEQLCSGVVEEGLAGETLEGQVLRLASQKAGAVAAAKPGRWVLAADTLVEAADGRALGKPGSGVEARAMLERLSGTWHRVWTGVCLQRDQERHCFVVQTRVQFRDLYPEEIQAYVAGGEGMDKAGGYGIQGEAAKFVLQIEGSYSNVVGLPLAQVLEKLHACGLYPDFFEKNL